MGKLAADLDAEALQHRNAYYMAMANGNYEHAMHTIVMLNKSIRPKNRVQMIKGIDLSPLARDSYYTFKDELIWNNDCKAWCYRYGPLVQDAFAREREALLKEYDR